MLFRSLAGIIDAHVTGTRYSIHMDAADGLLYAGEPGVQLTWMDAKVGDWVVTPRIGKPVEINALWVNALETMAGFSRVLDRASDKYEALSAAAQQGFQRFWNESRNCCYDVIDAPLAGGVEDARAEHLDQRQQEEQAEERGRDRADCERKGVASKEPHAGVAMTTTRCGSYASVTGPDAAGGASVMR